MTTTSYRIDHDPDKHDDRAISLALAAQTLLASAYKPRMDSKRMAEAMSQCSDDLWKTPVWDVRR
jgi:hypothetical protein